MDVRSMKSAVVLAILVAGVGCTSVSGSFSGHGAGGDWTLVPNMCTSGLHNDYIGVDLYRRDPNDDTEIVVLVEDNAVLARIPGQGKMVVLGKADCTKLEAEVSTNGVKVNGVHGLSGSVTLDCERPEIGHVVGTAEFACF